MSRKLTLHSSLENLKREAKRWLRAIRAQEPDALARLARADAASPLPASPTLRDVQHALAREHGFPGWIALKAAVAAAQTPAPFTRARAIEELLLSSGRGDAALVEALLSDFPDLVNAFATLAGHTGRRTPLHFAVAHEAVVRILLERGANPNVRDEGDEAMPLHFAAERGNLDVVRLLVEHGADPVGDGTTHLLNVLGWATCFDFVYHPEVAGYLLTHGARHTIHTAVAMGDVAAIRKIASRSPEELDRAMDRTNRRRRPLHLAVVKKRPASLAALLELGAATEIEDAAGLTPLDQAALADERQMADLLLRHGARVRLPSAIALDRVEDIQRLLRAEPDGARPGGRWSRLIIRASERGPARIVEALIHAGASVHVRDASETAIDQTHGYTALHAAAANNNVEAARVLLAHGANPADREDKYWGTPAGWAAYFGHAEARDCILEGPIDIFDAISFRQDRIDEVLARDPLALERPFGEYVTGDPASKPWLNATWTPIAYAIAHAQPDAARILAARGARLDGRDSTGRTLVDLAREAGMSDLVDTLVQGGSRPTASPETPVADFLRWSCPDWRISGSEREYRIRDAMRLLQKHPEIARSGMHAAVVCGEIDEVHRLLRAHSAAASRIVGPKAWPPLLYLCAARLPLAAAERNAVEIARLLLDYGADPNAFYLGGNADIHYTALTATLGRGEELAPMHARARDLAQLLLQRGADPHDNQVLYNVFADHTSRHLLDDDIVWLLELMYEHSVRRGHKAAWENPEWPMFDMRGAPSLGHEERRHPGAHFMLSGAVDRNLLTLARWMLEHGAGPNTPPGALWRIPQRTLYQDALVRGHREMAELLTEYGAPRIRLERDDHDAFVRACLDLDRDSVRRYVARHPEVLRDHRPIFAAVKDDRADVVEMLIDLGVSPDVEDAAHGRTRPLHMAAWGAKRCAELLIARGADVDARDAHHDSPPIGWAAWAGRWDMVELLGRYSRDVWYLTYTGRVERLREVLGQDPQLARTSNADGETPLMWLPGDADAAATIATLLLDKGADPSMRNARGLTAADIARRRALDRVAEVLSATRIT